MTGRRRIPARAASHITWTPYDQARRGFMREADALLRIRPQANQTANEIRRRMYVCYMENRIRYYLAEEKRERCSLPPVEVRENDFHNTELAAVFAHSPAVAWLCRLQERIDGCGIPAGIRQEDVGRYNVRERKKEESL